MRGVIKQIFKEHWDEFVAIYGSRIRKNVFKEVEKMIKCGTLEDGWIEYKCEVCGEIKKLGFRCKSRFCNSCGKVHVDNWVESMTARLIKAKHRHMVFTIPEELREFFQRDRKLLKILPDCAAQVIKSWFAERNKKECFMPGIVTVIHTFGRDIKWNPHVHMIMTEGGVGKNTEWKPISFIPYEMLRLQWQKLLLDALASKLKNKKKEFKKLKNDMYNNLKDGFYVYGKGEIKTATGAAKYVGRYTGRPAIAESRIIGYDGKKVTFYYQRHEDGQRVEEVLDVVEFIKKVIIHIPEKHFKMVRYYGIYARHTNAKDKLFKLVNEKIAEEKKRLNKWEYRIMKTFGHDPLKCDSCSGKMLFYDIYYKNFGSMRDYFKKKFQGQVKKKIDDLIESYRAIRGFSGGKITPLFK